MMADIWFISDTHIGHANILKYCPWRQTWAANIDEMNEKIIDAWNETVKPGDVVYHLGDVAFAQNRVKEKYLADLRKRLNGEIKLIVGNHDCSVTCMRRCGFDAVKVLKLTYNFTRLMLRHAPKHFTDLDADESDILLHGHSHGSPVSKHLGSESYKLFDIGIDAIKTIRPVSISEVFTLFEGKSA